MNKALAHRPRRSSQSAVGATKKSPSHGDAGDGEQHDRRRPAEARQEDPGYADDEPARHEAGGRPLANDGILSVDRQPLKRTAGLTGSLSQTRLRLLESFGALQSLFAALQRVWAFPSTGVIGAHLKGTGWVSKRHAWKLGCVAASIGNALSVAAFASCGDQATADADT
jgi:hypothetical protein